MRDLRISALWGEIVRGWSEVSHSSLGKIYLKHLTYLAQAEIDGNFQDLVELAVSRGIPKEDGHLRTVIDQGLWSRESEAEIPRTEGYLQSLRQTKSKLIADWQKAQVQRDIDTAQKRLEELGKEKSGVLGLTAERYATHVITSFCISRSVFKDRDMTRRIFVYEGGDGEDEDIETVRAAYEARMSEFSEANLMRVALSPSFMNCFCMCDNNPFTFYGRPSVELTVFQAMAFVYGANFRAMLSDPELKPPSDVMDDPDTLTDWYEKAKQAKSEIERTQTQSGAAGIPGMRGRDYASMGFVGEDMSEKLSKLAKAKGSGGSLGFDEILKAHGL